MAIFIKGTEECIVEGLRPEFMTKAQYRELQEAERASWREEQVRKAERAREAEQIREAERASLKAERARAERKENTASRKEILFCLIIYGR